MIVHKFGGTSVGNAERFGSVADIIIDSHNKSQAPGLAETVIVVSAMSGVTDLLIAGARAAADGQDTAYRDILDLVDRGALKKDPGGGRSTSYSLATANCPPSAHCG